MKDLISVILATRNGASTLPRAIDSILAQSHAELELIIIDDESSDDTRAVVETYMDDHRVRYVRNESRRGLARSLNRAIDIASGKYIARMDDDDVSLPERLEKQLEYMVGHPDVDVLGSGALLVAADMTQIRERFMPENDAEIKKAICKFCPFIHPSVMFRRSFLVQSGGYNEKLNRKEDYDLWGRGASYSKYHNLQEVLLHYRVKQTKTIRAVPSGFLVRVKNGFRCKCVFTALIWAVFYTGVSLLRFIGYVQRAHRN